MDSKLEWSYLQSTGLDLQPQLYPIGLALNIRSLLTITEPCHAESCSGTEFKGKEGLVPQTFGQGGRISFVPPYFVIKIM